MATIKNEADLLLQAIVPRFTPLSVAGLTDDQLTTIANMTTITSNNIVAVAEKSTFNTWWTDVVKDYTVLNEQSAILGLNATIRADYTTNYNTLAAIVTPVLVNLLIDDIIDGDAFTSAIYDYYIKRQELIQERTTYYNQNLLAGRGVNVCHPRYCSFEEAALPPLVASATATPTLDSTFSYFGSKSLRITASGDDAYVYLGSSSTDYNVIIKPNEKWIISGMVRCSGFSNKPVQLYIKTSAGNHYGIAANTSSTAGEWTQISGVLDLTADSSTRAIFRVDNDGGTGIIISYDGLMLEELAGEITIPSAFNQPPNFRVDYTGAMDATKGATIGTDLNGQITPTNYQTFIANNTITKMSYSNNAGTSSTSITTSLSFDSDNQNVLAIITGVLESKYASDVTFRSSMVCKLKVNGTYILNKFVAVTPNAPVSTISGHVVSFSEPVLIAAPGSSAITYIAELHYSDTGGGTTGHVGDVGLTLMALKR